MEMNYCKLTEDLLPLYTDNLLSSETKEFVQDHLNHCSSCQKKLAFFSEKLNYPMEREDFFENSLEDSKYDGAKKFVQKVRKRIKYIFLFGLILLFIVGAVSYEYGKGHQGEGPVKVTSAEDYAVQTIPGWDRAERAGQIKKLGITKPIPGTSAQVTFEKVWYTKNHTYILYTVKDPEKKYYLARGEEIDVPPHNEKSNQSMFPYGQRYGGISKTGVHQVMVFMGYDTPVPKEKLTLTIPKWAQGPFPPKELREKEIESPVSISLTLNDDDLKDPVEVVKLNKQFQWGERQLKIERLEASLSETRLYGEIKLKEGEKRPSVSGRLKSGEQIAALSMTKVKPGKEPNSFMFEAYANPLNTWPEKLDLEIKSLGFQSSDHLIFPFDWDEYKGQKGRITLPEAEQSTEEFYDGEIKLWQVEPERGITFKVLKPQKQTLYPVTMNPEANIYTGKGNSGLKVSNDKGESASIHSTWGGSIFGDDEEGFGFGIDLDQQFWKNSHKVKIELINPRAEMTVNQSLELYPQ